MEKRLQNLHFLSESLCKMNEYPIIDAGQN